jgi:aldehyde dehydrogenase (NAD+)
VQGVTRARQADLARAITTEMGAPADVAMHEQAAGGVPHLKDFLAAAGDVRWEEAPPTSDVLLRRPVGVCDPVTPWN